LQNILKVGKSETLTTGAINSYAQIVEQFGGLDKLQQLQRHENLDIHRQSTAILRMFFAQERAN
jgi:hypothetical protein